MARVDVSEERRAQILDAAVGVFSRDGFERARMEDVAREAGLAKGTLYLYYRSKDDLVEALLRLIFGQGMEALKAAMQGEGSAGERLLALSRRMVDEIDEFSGLLPIWFEFYAVAARNESVKRFVRDYFREYRESLAGVVREGVKRGEFRRVDAAEVATTFVAIFEGATLLWAFDPDSVPIKRQVETSVELLLRGLSGERVHSKEA